MGKGDFSPAQIKAYFDLQGVIPTQWEIDGLIAIHSAKVASDGKS